MPSRPVLRPLILAAALVAAACGELAVAPQGRPTAPLALAMAFPGAPTASAIFGQDVDSVRVGVYRRNESTALDTIIAWPARDEGLRIAFDIPLLQKVETLYVYVDLMAGRSVLFYANSEVVLQEEVVPSIPALPLTYIGPGYDAVFLTVSPRTAFVVPGGTLPFTASAQNAQQAIVPAPVAWSVSDTRLATIDALGVLTARSATGSLWVRATTPTGLADSVQVQVATQLP